MQQTCGVLRRQLGLVVLRRAPVPAAPSGVVRTYGLGSHVSDNDPEMVDKAQKRHLEGKTKSQFPEEAPGWEEVLASDSEAVVKAEQSHVMDFKEMRRMTIESLKEEVSETTTKSTK